MRALLRFIKDWVTIQGLGHDSGALSRRVAEATDLCACARAAAARRCA